MGVGLVLAVSFLLTCMYLVHAMMIRQDFAMCVGWKLLQEVQGSQMAYFSLLQPNKLLYQIKLNVQNQNSHDYSPRIAKNLICFFFLHVVCILHALFLITLTFIVVRLAIKPENWCIWVCLLYFTCNLVNT